jgi:hypothetical protein
MLGIPRKLAEHELQIFPNAKPIKQSMRRHNPEKARSMGEEINRLLEAKFIREIKEATWLSPPVMEEKKDTKIYRMCIDFTTLNKHCPKDHFPESTRSSIPPPAASISYSSTHTLDTTR